jgi:hypothetical protein
MRIAATTLEKYRLYMKEDFVPESDLIATIKGEYHETPEMRLGRAYHAILERPQRALSGFYESDGFRFEDAAIENLLDRLRPGLCEVKTSKELLVPGAGVCTLVAKCDHISGASISEFKTTLDSFDSEKYLASAQWRIYLYLFQAQFFTYHVACLKEDGDRFALKSLESMNCFPYPDLERDVRELVREFCSYVKARGLESYLIPKVEKAEAR